MISWTRLFALPSVSSSPILSISGFPTMTVQRQTLGGPPRTTEYATPRYFILTERWGVKAVPPRPLADCLGHLLTL
jgi:hypothetical protein